MSAGVYLLNHVPSWQFYVGSSIRLEDRREYWFRVLGELSRSRPDQWCRRSPSPRFVQAACGTKPGEWRFRVVRQLDWAVPRSVLWAAEYFWIERALRVGGRKCLNIDVGGRSRFYLHGGRFVPESTLGPVF